MIQYILYIFFATTLISCNTTETIVQENNLSTSYETWVAGVRGGGSGINFYVDLKTEGNQQKFDGDDSQIYTSPKNALTLAENEAILIFLKNGKEIRQTIKEVKEKPMLLYPSTKPKN